MSGWLLCLLTLIVLSAFATGVVLGAVMAASRTQRRSDEQAALERIREQ